MISAASDRVVQRSCGVAVTLVAVRRLTRHLFCLPVLAVSCRIMLVCAKRSLYAAFSVLPYGEHAHLRYNESTHDAVSPAPHCSVFILLYDPRCSQKRCVFAATAGSDMCLFVNSDPKLDTQRQRLSSVVAPDLRPALEGVELGAFGKVRLTFIETWFLFTGKCSPS